LPLPYWDWFRITLYHYQEPLPTTAHKIWQLLWRSSTPTKHRQTYNGGRWQEKEATTAVLPSMLLLISKITPFAVTHPSYPLSCPQNHRIVWCGSISYWVECLQPLRERSRVSFVWSYWRFEMNCWISYFVFLTSLYFQYGAFQAGR